MHGGLATGRDTRHQAPAASPVAWQLRAELNFNSAQKERVRQLH